MKGPETSPTGIFRIFAALALAVILGFTVNACGGGTQTGTSTYVPPTGTSTFTGTGTGSLTSTSTGTLTGTSTASSTSTGTSTSSGTGTGTGTSSGTGTFTGTSTGWTADKIVLGEFATKDG